MKGASRIPRRPGGSGRAAIMFLIVFIFVMEIPIAAICVIVRNDLCPHVARGLFPPEEVVIPDRGGNSE